MSNGQELDKGQNFSAWLGKPTKLQLVEGWKEKAMQVAEEAYDYVRNWNKHIESKAKRGENLTPFEQKILDNLSELPDFSGKNPAQPEFKDKLKNDFIAQVKHTKFTLGDLVKDENEWDPRLSINLEAFTDKKTGILKQDDATWASLFSTMVHEAVHSAGGAIFESSPDYKRIVNMMSPSAKKMVSLHSSNKPVSWPDKKKIYPSGRKHSNKHFYYLTKPTEVHARIMQVRYAMGWKNFGDINQQKQLISGDINIPEEIREKRWYKDLIDVIGKDNIKKAVIEVSEGEQPTSPENEFMEWVSQDTQSIF